MIVFSSYMLVFLGQLDPSCGRVWKREETSVSNMFLLLIMTIIIERKIHAKCRLSLTARLKRPPFSQCMNTATRSYNLVMSTHSYAYQPDKLDFSNQSLERQGLLYAGKNPRHLQARISLHSSPPTTRPGVTHARGIHPDPACIEAEKKPRRHVEAIRALRPAVRLSIDRSRRRDDYVPV